MPKSGQDTSQEEQNEFSNKLGDFLLWTPRSILESAIERMYKESPCFREMVKNLANKP